VSHKPRASCVLLDAVSATDHRPEWPEDPDHRDAIDTVLLMAEAADRWGEASRALELLDSMQEIVGTLPLPYERIRSRCRGDTVLA
jgi:hypothetical protein